MAYVQFSARRIRLEETVEALCGDVRLRHGICFCGWTSQSCEMVSVCIVKEGFVVGSGLGDHEEQRNGGGTGLSNDTEVASRCPTPRAMPQRSRAIAQPTSNDTEVASHCSTPWAMKLRSRAIAQPLLAMTQRSRAIAQPHMQRHRGHEPLPNPTSNDTHVGSHCLIPRAMTQRSRAIAQPHEQWHRCHELNKSNFYRLILVIYMTNVDFFIKYILRSWCNGYRCRTRWHELKSWTKYFT